MQPFAHQVHKREDGQRFGWYRLVHKFIGVNNRFFVLWQIGQLHARGNGRRKGKCA